MVCVVLVSVLLSALSAPGCATHAQHRAHAEQRWNQVRAGVKYQLAQQQFDRGQIEAAVETTQQAVAEDSSSSDAYLLLAHCYLEQGKLASAGQAVVQAERYARQSPEVEYTRGLIAERADELDTALEHYRQARLRDDTVVDYLVAEAECLVALGRPEEALGLVSEELARFDSDGTLETLLAQIALLVGDREEGVRNLRLAVERSGCGTAPATESTGCDLLIEEYGRLLAQTGRYAEAVALLRPYVEARREVPSSVVAALCTAYLNTGRVSDAEHRLREEVRRHPNDSRGWMLLARAATAAGDWMTARRCTERLTRLTPQDGAAFLLHGFVCTRQNDLGPAEESLKRALALSPQDGLARGLLGQVRARRGR